MWSRLTGGSAASSSGKDEESRRRRTSDSTRSKRDRDADARSVVSSPSSRKPSRRDTAPSSIASFTTAFDDMPRSRSNTNTNTNSDLYDDASDRYDRRRDDRPGTYAASSVSRVRDEKDRRKGKDSDKDRKSEKRRSSRSERPGSSSQAGGYRGDIVDSPTSMPRSFSGQIGSDGFSQFPGQAGAPMMAGALPVGSHAPSSHADAMSSHVQSQFPGQDPAQYASSALPGGHPFGAAAEYYNDQGQSVQQQPGVRPQPPSVIIGQDTPHLMAASAQPNPAADTGSGTAADFYGPSTSTPSSKPPRPSSSSMPGAFIDDGPAPQKPPRPSSSSRPDKPSKFGPAATLAGGAALGYAMGHGSSHQEHPANYSSSSSHHTTSHTTNTPGASASTYNMYNQGNGASNTTNGSGYLPPYSGAAYGAEGPPPPKPPRPAKPEKHSSGSNAGLYAAGAAGLAAYGLHHHNSHSNSHSHSHSHNTAHDHASTHGHFAGQHHNGVGSSSYMSGGMAQQHQHTGPVSKFVDWWKDYEDVQKMEEYTEYIGVCKGCFDPRSSVMDAPRKHHYYKRRSNEHMRPSGGIEKQSRYSLKEKKSHSSFSSGDERRRKNKGSAAGWVAAGLGGIGLAKAGKAVLNAGRDDDFDDTYSIKSGRSKISRPSRSRSRDRQSYGYGYPESRRRSHSRDRMSHMSVGVTNDRKDRKDYKVVRRHSRSRSSSSSSSGHGKSGLIGTAIGTGLAGAALAAATSKKRHSHSRSQSPKKAYVQHHRRDSSDDERRRRRSQQLRRKASRSSTSGASVIEIGQTHEPQGGFLGGFFAAPPAKEKRPKTTSLKKKKKGFFNFGNASTSSSDSEMAFGTGYVRRRRRSSPKRRNSDERLKASLIGLGATAAAITAAKASKGKRHSEVVAVKEPRHGRKGSDRPRPGSRYGDDEWEDLPDEDTSESSDAGLVYGDYDLKKTKSHESMASNDSGTNKWNWRWGFGKKKRRSSDNLYDNIANTSLIGPTAAGAAGAFTGAAIGSRLSRHDSESSSAQTLQSVYPVAPNDPTASFDARRTSSIGTSQPLVTSAPGPISIQQPQPMHQVPGAIYSTQPSSQPGYTAPAGPPIFSQAPSQPPYPMQFQTQNVIVQSPQHPSFRRANSSPMQTSSWKRDAALAGTAAIAGAVTVSALKHPDRPPSASSNVRFNLTQEQADKEMRERRKEQERRDEEENRRRDQQRREDDARREQEERVRREQQRRDEEENRRRDRQRRDDETRREREEHARREQQLRDEEARKIEEERRQTLLRLEDTSRQEDGRRRRELQRQQEEARKFMEIERLAKIETERRREQQEMQAREARGAEDRERQERAARMDSQRQLALEATEAERKRRERREAAQQEAERIDVARREAEIQADLDRRRQEREYADRYDTDRARKLEQQPTGSSIGSTATVVQRKEQELQDRERELFHPDTKKSSVAGAVAAGAAAAIATAAISSYKDKEKERERDRNRGREHAGERERGPESPPAAKIVEPSYKPGRAVVYEPTSVKTIEPSKIEQDYHDEDIFNPDIFKKKAPVGQHARDVLQDWEDRYSAVPVSQAEFFAPKELLQNDNLPKVHVVDPNEGAPDLHTYRAHDEHDIGQHMVPPYPPSYSFTATKNGRPSQQQPPPVPTLNLILPTPPSSRTPSVRSASVPPSPAIEPIKEETKQEPRPDELNRARSRVSWGENQFHHFDVPTPDSYREQFVSDGDLDKQEPKYSHDVVTVEHDSPKSGQKTSTYKPYHPEEPKEIAPSTQYIRDEDDSTWDSVAGAASKKSSKKDRKKSKAAAAAAALSTAAALSQEEQDEWDFKRDTSSVTSNPFSDTNKAPSTIAPSVVSAAPSSSSVQTAYYQPVSEREIRRAPNQAAVGPGFVEGEVAEDAAPMHIPGSFDEVPGDETPMEEASTSSKKQDRKGKKKSRGTDESVVTQELPRAAEPEPTVAPEPVKEVKAESEARLSKDKKKKLKAAKRASVDTWEMSDVSPPPSPTKERDIRDIEPSRPVELSRSIEPSRPVELARNYTPMKSTSQHEESSGGKAATAAMAGGFAALVGSAMAQDQDRMASDLERARRNLESAERHIARDPPSSPPNGTRASDDGAKNVTIPSYAFEGVDELADKTPKRKKEKRHSSGRWSPTIGSPLRTETKYEDYMGAQGQANVPDTPAFVEAPKVPTVFPFTTAPESGISRNVNDSGYYAPDDFPRMIAGEKDSDDFYSAGSDEKDKSRAKPRESYTEDYYDDTKAPSRHDEEDARSGRKYDDDDMGSIVPSSSKYDDPDREERRRRRREARSETREHSRDRGYDLEERGERRRRHRRHETDEGVDDWDTRSTISEARSEANGERRRKHRRRESEKDVSPESKTRSRSSAASEPGDLYDDRKSSRRRSKRHGDDDNASVVSSIPGYDEDRSPKKEKEKRSSGFLGLFSSKSKESLIEPSTKSSRSKDDDDEERKHRRRKHRSDRGSTYGSDDDDARSTISSSSRREKRSSRSERGEGEKRDDYDDKVHRSSYVR
ncbi:hypothetical protein BDW02DRAFT_568426 [Decorospora gaudefroyi]|uniref:Involucrin repeat protein n=1 Tax=Decorospora gaudefroyi TaxID=184978 RepID=A0A6A5KG05_9PLEO|nr:hypothetical protein BDW02DRAFT_568426 [Decorospora gaudefroyi]